MMPNKKLESCLAPLSVLEEEICLATPKKVGSKRKSKKISLVEAFADTSYDSGFESPFNQKLKEVLNEDDVINRESTKSVVDRHVQNRIELNESFLNCHFCEWKGYKTQSWPLTAKILNNKQNSCNCMKPKTYQTTFVRVSPLHEFKDESDVRLLIVN